jgi:hypothetical protein
MRGELVFKRGREAVGLMSRGIDVVRNKIKGFAQRKVTLPPGRHKIIILDEADSYVSVLLLPPHYFFLSSRDEVRLEPILSAPLTYGGQTAENGTEVEIGDKLTPE